MNLCLYICIYLCLSILAIAVNIHHYHVHVVFTKMMTSKGGIADSNLLFGKEMTQIICALAAE